MNASTFRASRSPWFAVAVTSIGFAVVQLDVTIVNVALPSIGAEFGASLASLQWIVDAYALSFAALLLSAGALSDSLGARGAYAAGFATFALASLMCGVAPDAPSLIAARALQGVGAALLVPSSLALLDVACGDDRALRARAVGLWTAAGGVSIAAGPLVGGAILEALDWRSVFFVNVPLCAGAMVFAFRWLDAKPHKPGSHRFDPIGQVLAIVALTTLVASIIESSVPGAHRAWIVGGLATALLAGLAFCLVEARARAPMLPLAFLRRPAFATAVVFGIVANMAYYGIVFVLSLYLQRARGYSALDAGLAYLPLTATFIVSNAASGALTARHGARAPMAAGALIAAAGFTLLARLDATTSFAAMLPPFALIPLGIGLAVPAMTTAMLSSVERRWAATAVGALNAARQLGGAIGVALFGAIAGLERIISGLHEAAHISAALLVVAAAIAWKGLRRAAPRSADSETSTDSIARPETGSPRDRSHASGIALSHFDPR